METPSREVDESESATPQGPEDQADTSDLSQGYCIHLYVTPEGFRVSEALPLSADEMEGNDADHDGDTETYPDLTTALKHIVAEVKQNPIGEDHHAQFQAGYDSGPGGQAS